MTDHVVCQTRMEMSLLLPWDKEITPPCPACADKALAEMTAKQVEHMRGRT